MWEFIAGNPWNHYFSLLIFLAGISEEEMAHKKKTPIVK
jgi:hypothetical protein